MLFVTLKTKVLEDFMGISLVKPSLSKLAIALACGLLLSFNSAFAAPESPSQGIKRVIELVQVTVTKEKATLSEEALDAKLRDLIAPLFNFDEMARRCLGNNWKKATEAQQKEFVSLFSDLLGRTYLKRIKRNAESSKITEISDEITDDKAFVKSTVRAEDEDIAIDYRLILQNGEWKIYDVIVENVGLVTNYRSEFPEIIRHEGFEGLLQRLRNKQVAPPKEKA